MSETYDFIVVGAGIVGAAVAYELAPSGRVCVLETEARGGMHATGRSAALYAPSYGGAEIRALTRASRGFLVAPPMGFCEQPLLRARGCLYIARNDQVTRVREMAARIERSGGHVRLVGEKEILSFVPLLRHSYASLAAWDAEAMDIDVDGLHQGFLRGARARGALVVTDAPLTEAKRHDGIWSIETRAGTFRTPVIVNAAGAWADEVAVALGAEPLGLQPLRRTALTVQPPAAVDVRPWPAVIDADEEFYFKPDAGKLLLSPADETPDKPRDVYPEDLDVAIAVDRVQAVLDLEITRVSQSWAGLRTFTRDRVPAVGFDSDTPGLFWCAGQGGYGVQSAPAMGRLAAALALRESLPSEIIAEGLSSYAVSPLRFKSSP